MCYFCRKRLYLWRWIILAYARPKKRDHHRCSNSSIINSSIYDCSWGGWPSNDCSHFVGYVVGEEQKNFRAEKASAELGLGRSTFLFWSLGLFLCLTFFFFFFFRWDPIVSCSCLVHLSLNEAVAYYLFLKKKTLRFRLVGI